MGFWAAEYPTFSVKDMLEQTMKDESLRGTCLVSEKWGTFCDLSQLPMTALQALVRKMQIQQNKTKEAELGNKNFSFEQVLQQSKCNLGKGYH